MKKLIVVISLSLFFSSPSFADVPKEKQTKLGLYLDSKAAYFHMQKYATKSLFVDIRTRAEVNFLGMPDVADTNIPYMKLNEWYEWDADKKMFKLELNPQFAQEIGKHLHKKGLNKSSPIILMCRSGTRSAKAVDLLSQHGYTRVYSVLDGYEGDSVKLGKYRGKRILNGWRNNQLPWSYHLRPEKMYFAELQ